MSVEAIELMRKVALRFQAPAALNHYALSLALNGNPGEAIRQLRVKRALHGEKTYAQVRNDWTIAATKKYPQLKDSSLP